MSDSKRRLKLIIELEYDADPRYYGTSEPKAMAEIDEDGLGNDLDTAFDLIANPPHTSDMSLKVVPVE